MIKKILISFIVGFLFFQSIAVVNAENYSSSVTIQNRGAKKYKGIRLDSKIANKSNHDLSDLLLVNQKNEIVPYFLNGYAEDSSRITKSYEMKLINSFVKEPNFFYDYTLINPIKGDMQATSIEVTTPDKNFVKNVTLLGSYDNLNWEMVQNDIFYSVEGNQKLNINLNGIKKFTHYRFQIAGLLDRISFNSVILIFNQDLQRKEYFLETLTPQFIVITENRFTKVTINSLRNLDLYDLTIETNDMFKRKVSFDNQQTKILYNLVFKNNKYMDLAIPLEFYKVLNDTAELLIENNDDKPIQINKILIRRFVNELVFDGSNTASFILKFGNPSINNPPSYDIVSYKESIIQEGYDLLSIGDIKAEPTPIPPPPPPKPKNYQWLFNLIIIVVAILLGFILLVRVKKE